MDGYETFLTLEKSALSANVTLDAASVDGVRTAVDAADDDDDDGDDDDDDEDACMMHGADSAAHFSSLSLARMIRARAQLEHMCRVCPGYFLGLCQVEEGKEERKGGKVVVGAPLIVRAHAHAGTHAGRHAHSLQPGPRLAGQTQLGRQP